MLNFDKKDNLEVFRSDIFNAFSATVKEFYPFSMIMYLHIYPHKISYVKHTIKLTLHWEPVVFPNCLPAVAPSSNEQAVIRLTPIYHSDQCFLILRPGAAAEVCRPCPCVLKVFTIPADNV